MIYNEIIKRFNDLFTSTDYKILIDAVIFEIQPNGGGISMVWKNYLNELSKSELSNKIIITNRKKTAPKHKTFHYIGIKTKYEYGKLSENAELIDKICIKHKISLFISTYLTYSNVAKNLLFLHDFIPEKLNWDISGIEWQDKNQAISKSHYFVAISHNTLNDFYDLYPDRQNDKATVIHNAAYNQKLLSESDNNFKEKHKIDKDYFLLIGHRWSHKNTLLFLKAISYFEDKTKFEIIFTGGSKNIEEEFRAYLKDFNYRVVGLSDSEMVSAYRNAIALIYPSKYEGFGLPILEAMQCGCPVITCSNSSIKEIAKDCCIYTDEDNSLELYNNLIEVQKQDIREHIIKEGLNNAQNFSWQKSAKSLIMFINELLANNC